MSVIFYECHFDECHFVECHFDECHYVECHYDGCHHDGWHYYGCHYDVCSYDEGYSVIMPNVGAPLLNLMNKVYFLMSLMLWQNKLERFFRNFLSYPK